MTNKIATEKIPTKVIAAIVATGLMSFCGVIVETAMNIAFPKLMQEFSISTSTVQWMTSIYLLLVAIVVPLSAFFKANFKMKKLFLVAITLFILGIICDILAPNFAFLLLGRAIQGIGTGISLPLMFNLIMEQVPSSKLGFMIGIGNLITGVAPAIGPTLGGLIVTSLGWRYIFIILLPLLLFSLCLGLWGIKQKSAIVKSSIDFLSLILIDVMFISLVFGFSNLSTANFLSWQVAGALSIGIIALVFLARHSLRIKQAIIDFSLFKNLRFAGHALIFFLVQMCSLGFAFLLPNYIQIVNSNSALVAGLIVMPAGLFGAMMSPIGGRLLDEYGPKKPILMGSSSILFAIVLFSIFAQNLNNLFIAVVYIFYMAGMGSMMGTIMTSALASVADRKKTQANAILNTLQQFAGSMGTSIVAMIVALSQAGQLTKMRTALGSQHAFFLLLLMSLIIIFTSLKVVPKQLSK